MAKNKRYRAEDVFDSYEDYIKYMKVTYSLFQDLKKSNNPSFSMIVPENLKIEFKPNIQEPRLYIPRNKGIIVVQLPIEKEVGTKGRDDIHTRAIITFSPILKLNEKAMAEEFAISKKLFDSR